MVAKTICLVACLIGIVMMGASWYWTNTLGGQVAWSEEDAQQYVNVASKLHQTTYEHAAAQNKQGVLGSMNRDVADGELAAAKDAWETQRQKRDDAINFRKFWGNVLFGVGILGILGGGIGYLVMGGMSDQS